MKKIFFKVVFALLSFNGLQAHGSSPYDPLFKNVEMGIHEPIPSGLCQRELQIENQQLHLQQWPLKFATFVSHELAQFPLLSKVAPFVEGIYVADFFEHDQDDLEASIPVLLCLNKQTQHYSVVLNSTLLITRAYLDRLDGESYASLEGSYVVREPGDLTLRHLFYSLFFIYDKVTFPDPASLPEASLRRKFMELSWHNGKITKHTLPHLHDAYTDKIASKKATIVYLSALRHTNFIVPDATTSPSADFAETLVTYYMGTKYNQWQRFGYNENGRKHYQWDVRKILMESETHFNKLRFLSKHVLDEDFLKMFLTL